MRKTRSLSMALFLCLVTTSCVTLGSCGKKAPTPTPDPVPHVSVDIPKQITAIQDVRKAVEAGVSSIKTDAASIKSETSIGRKDYPKATQWDSIDKKVESIDKVGDAVDTKVKDLNAASAEMIVVEAERKRQEEFIKQSQKLLEDERAKAADLQNKIKEYEDGAKKRQQMIWMTVSGFAALGFVIGIFLFIYAKSELGISLCISSLVLACISYFMAAYALYVAIVGGIILLLIMCYLIYFLFIHKKALGETITSFEDIKRKSWDDPGVKQGVAVLQSNTTKKIVHDLRLEKGLK